MNEGSKVYSEEQKEEFYEDMSTEVRMIELGERVVRHQIMQDRSLEDLGKLLS